MVNTPGHQRFPLYFIFTLLRVEFCILTIHTPGRRESSPRRVCVCKCVERGEGGGQSTRLAALSFFFSFSRCPSVRSNTQLLLPLLVPIPRGSLFSYWRRVPLGR